MSTMRQRIIQLLVIMILMVAFPSVAKASTPTVKYQAHIQNEGWLNSVTDGQTAGSTGKGYRLEAFKIHLKDSNGNNGVSYRAHVSNIGWQEWVTSGNIAGTTGRSLAVEAVQIKLSAELAKNYDIYYRAHVENYGWLDWVKNGVIAGTTGKGLRAEAIQIKLVKKATGSSASQISNTNGSQEYLISLPDSVLSKMKQTTGNQKAGTKSCKAYAMSYYDAIVYGKYHSYKKYWNGSKASGSSSIGCVSKTFTNEQAYYKAAVKELVEKRRPCIMYVKQKNGVEHWVLAVGCKLNKATYSLSDFIFYESIPVKGQNIIRNNARGYTELLTGTGKFAGKYILVAK